MPPKKSEIEPVRAILPTLSLDDIKSMMNGEDKLASRISDKFTDNQQQMFITGFLYHVKNKSTDFVIDFDDAWKYAGYSSKGNAKACLINPLKELVKDTHYTIKSASEHSQPLGALLGDVNEKIFLTLRGFKLFCMAAGTSKAIQFHSYYVSLEEGVFEAFKEFFMRILAEKDAQIADITLQLTDATEKIEDLVTSAPELQLCKSFKKDKLVYIVELEEELKFGIVAENIDTRLAQHKRICGKQAKLVHVVVSSKNKEIEDLVKDNFGTVQRTFRYTLENEEDRADTYTELVPKKNAVYKGKVIKNLTAKKLYDILLEFKAQVETPEVIIRSDATIDSLQLRIIELEKENKTNYNNYQIEIVQVKHDNAILFKNQKTLMKEREKLKKELLGFKENITRSIDFLHITEPIQLQPHTKEEISAVNKLKVMEVPVIMTDENNTIIRNFISVSNAGEWLEKEKIAKEGRTSVRNSIKNISIVAAKYRFYREVDREKIVPIIMKKRTIGVRKKLSGKFDASFTINSTFFYIGTFDTEKEASDARTKIRDEILAKLEKGEDITKDFVARPTETVTMKSIDKSVLRTFNSIAEAGKWLKDSEIVKNGHQAVSTSIYNNSMVGKKYRFELITTTTSDDIKYDENIHLGVMKYVCMTDRSMMYTAVIYPNSTRVLVGSYNTLRKTLDAQKNKYKEITGLDYSPLTRVNIPIVINEREFVKAFDNKAESERWLKTSSTE